jgi:TonB family protein
MNLAHYLLQANIYLIVFYGFYRLLLDRETYFILNRIYLLSAACFSLLIPFIQIDWFTAQPVTQNVSVGVSQLYMVAGLIDAPAPAATWGTLTALLYVVVTSGLLLRFIVQLSALGRLMRSIPEGTAFSFFKRVVIHHDLPDKDVINKHEQIHMRQMHSMDVMFFELLGIFNWFNPVIFLYKASIRNVHEYLADEEAAKFQGDKTQYALLLLSKAFGVNPNTLTNSFFNKSMIKKRITMLHKEKSRKTAILKYGLFVPLFGLTLILSSATLRKNETIRTAAESIPLDQPLNVVKEVLPKAMFKAPDPKATLKIKGDTVDGRWIGFYAYLGTKLQYPKEAVEAKAEGNSLVTFSISGGSVDNVKSYAKVGNGCDQQVMKTLLGYQNFKYLPDGNYLLNVRFKLQGSTTAPVNAEIHSAPGFTTLNQLVVGVNPAEQEVEAPLQEKVYDFVSVDTPPNFPGGIEKFYSFIGRSIKYPAEAVKNKVQGKVFLHFIVEQDGRLSNIKVDRRLGAGTDEEAVRVLESSPRWIPGIKNKQTVRVMYNIPISFTLGEPTKTGTPDSSKVAKIGPTTKYYIDGEEATAETFKKLNDKNVTSMNVIKASDGKSVKGSPIPYDVIIIKTKSAKAEPSGK